MPTKKSQPFMLPWHHRHAEARLLRGRGGQVRGWTRFASVKLFWLYAFPGLFLWLVAFHWLGVDASMGDFINDLWMGPSTPLRSFVLMGVVLALAFNAWSLKTCILGKVVAGKLESVFSLWMELFWRAVPAALFSLAAWGLWYCAACVGSRTAFALLVSSAWFCIFLAAQFLFDLLVRGFFGRGRGRQKIQLRKTDFGKARPGFTTKLRVAHLADLHLTKNPQTLAVSGGAGGNLAFGQLMRRQIKPLEGADSIFICGDVADAGRSSEWEVFFKAFPGHLLKKTILVPGNHDVNIIDPADRLAQDPDLVLRRKRLIRTMAALDLVQGDRAWVLDERLQKVLLRDYLASFQEDFKAYIENPPKPLYDTGALAWLEALFGLKRFDIDDLETQEHVALPAEVWDAIFPMAIEFPGTKVVALVLDSNTAASSLLDNALGRISPAALHRLHHFQERYKGWAQLILLHHHVALPPLNFGFLGNLQADLMTLLNADQLLETVSEKKGLVFFHGHKHLDYMAELDGEFQIFSAPSSTLGDELDPERGKGYFTMELSTSKDGRAAVIAEPKFFGI